MKKLVILLLCLALTSCATIVQIACYEPNIEIVIDDVNYGVPPIIYKGAHDLSYVDVNFVRNGVTIHQQRLYLVGKRNYYEIELPKHLKKSQNVNKYHSNY